LRRHQEGKVEQKPATMRVDLRAYGGGDVALMIRKYTSRQVFALPALSLSNAAILARHMDRQVAKPTGVAPKEKTDAICSADLSFPGRVCHAQE
jgi:hypothetical protein